MTHRLIVVALSSSLVLQPMSLLAAPPAPGIPPAVQAPAATGGIIGSARNSAGQSLPGQTVQVRNLQTGQLAGTTMSNASGGFSFTGLTPASYAVEVVSPNGTILGTSAATAVAPGAIATVTVTSTAAALAGAAAGISTALIVTTVAAAAGVVGVTVAVQRRDASPSD